MKKTMSIIVLFSFLLISVAANTGRVYEAAEGYKAPLFAVEQNDTAFSLDDLKGSYVLVNFWASSDAQSRLRAAEYTAAAKSLEEGQVNQLQVNLDHSERLFSQIVRMDRLEGVAHYHVGENQAAKLAKAYRLNHGFNSFLIDPEGRIVETNPSVNTVLAIAAKR